jgi:transposase InsO family protein
LEGSLTTKEAHDRKTGFRDSKRPEISRWIPAFAEKAGMKIFEFIEGWNNPHRRHQGLGYHSPMDFESHHQEAA